MTEEVIRPCGLPPDEHTQQHPLVSVGLPTEGSFQEFIWSDKLRCVEIFY
jgi:hypothetical protein